MKRNIVKINEQQLKKIVAESVKKVLKERIGNDLDSFYNYVVNRFNQEHIEIGDAGDVEELYQGCSNYNYETEPFDKLYQKVKNDWLQYKSEQQNDIVAESVKKVLKEESKYNDENWDNEQENIMCFDLFSKFGLSESERHEILSATLFDREDKPIGRLNDFHVKYDARNGRNAGLVGSF